MNILKNEPLCRHTTLRVGGLARFFVRAQTDDDICEAVHFAKSQDLRVLLLGGGSNILISDSDFNGLVIRVATAKIRLEERNGGAVELIGDAGAEWDHLVAFAVEHNLFGLENMSLIPGTVGGAVVGNIGAYGAEVKDTLAWVEVFNMQSRQLHRFTCADCAFRYRHSLFKTWEGRSHIVLRAGFALQAKGTPNTSYKDLKEHFAAQGISSPALNEVRNAVISIRQSKLPDLAKVGTAGSFFKNPVVPRAKYEKLQACYPALPGHQEGDDSVKIPLGWVLDKLCGLKGIRKGKVGTHGGQALVLINDGGTAAEVESFASEIAAAVLEKTGLQIEWEVEKIS